MINEQQFYYLHNNFNEIITGMNLKLHSFKEKNPSFDITESLDTINKLRNLQDSHHQLYHYGLVVGNREGKHMEERNRFIGRISQLEKEIETIKNNINL